MRIKLSSDCSSLFSLLTGCRQQTNVGRFLSLSSFRQKILRVRFTLLYSLPFISSSVLLLWCFSYLPLVLFFACFLTFCPLLFLRVSTVLSSSRSLPVASFCPPFPSVCHIAFIYLLLPIPAPFIISLPPHCLQYVLYMCVCVDVSCLHVHSFAQLATRAILHLFTRDGTG